MRGETVTVLTAGTVTDPYSNADVEDWTTPGEREVVTVAPVNPTLSNEPLQDARNQTTTGLTLYLPPADPITRKDRVRVWGNVYDVLGDPMPWASLGTEVHLTRSEG